MLCTHKRELGPVLHRQVARYHPLLDLAADDGAVRPNDKEAGKDRENVKVDSGKAKKSPRVKMEKTVR